MGRGTKPANATKADNGAIAIRPARDADAAAIIDLITKIFTEFPGCVLDVEADTPELMAPASSFAQDGGKIWVAEGVTEGAGLLGCIACRPAPDGGLELEKLYVACGARKCGLGGRLLDLVEAEAATRQARSITLWSDSRFEAAHAFYAARGYRRDGLKHLDDASHSIDFGFRKDL
jgi:putative acetyltransferase